MRDVQKTGNNVLKVKMFVIDWSLNIAILEKEMNFMREAILVSKNWNNIETKWSIARWQRDEIFEEKL